ncbi:amidohydrolase family protein [Streptomyces griseoaurantiacus]|uniref:amidohydrolase family protein n=1 Tax=Streptomyces griseoaurantiacus TaxID=68213 RepID=UPI00177B394A|nr:hypothetical protein GCM10018782_33280 [Streptomyces griseoaurantiacus]
MTDAHGAEVIDAHVHVRDPRRLRYGWLAGSALDRPRLPGDIDDAGGEVARWVFAEADAAPESAFEEARRAEEPAWPGPAATVVAADLEAPDAGERIERVAGLPLVRGIRHLLQDLPGERLAAPALRRGLAPLSRAGLVLDACVRRPRLDGLDRPGRCPRGRHGPRPSRQAAGGRGSGLGRRAGPAGGPAASGPS